MAEEYYLYECRHGDEKILAPATSDGWAYLLKQIERCNGMTVEECREDGAWIDEGEGFLSIDDGGRIETIAVSDLAG